MGDFRSVAGSSTMIEDSRRDVSRLERGVFESAAKHVSYPTQRGDAAKFLSSYPRHERVCVGVHICPWNCAQQLA